jgi:hypothetical protein
MSTLRFALTLAAVGATVGALCAGAALAGGKEEPKPSVTFAKSWDAAVAEAKTLVVPIVMHNHGFYCPPCWGMHAAVLHNEKYIAYANDNTVEVVAEQDLQKGVDEGKDKRGGTYDGKDEDGKPVKYMLEWPNLTLEEMLALHASPAGQYNKTNGIPYTSIIDPFTLKEIKGLPAGGHSPKEIMAECEAAKAQLNKEHGPSLKRATYQRVVTASRAVTATLDKSGAAAAMAEFAKLEASVAKEPDAIKAMTKPLEEKLLEAAKAALDDAEAKIGSGDAKGASAVLKALAPSLKGTELARRAAELLEKTKPAEPAK